MTARHLLTHKEAMLFMYVALAVVVLLEACAAYHFYFDQRDLFAAVVVATSWCKEGLKALVERVLT